MLVIIFFLLLAARTEFQLLGAVAFQGFLRSWEISQGMPPSFSPEL